MVPLDQRTVLTLLAAAPRRIARACRDMTDECLRRKPSVDSCSANEVLAHSRACAEVWGGSIMAMLTQDGPALRYVSPRSWIKKTNYTGLAFADSFREYAKQRKELLNVLRALRDTDWSRDATIKAATKHRKETVLSYAQQMARHQARHCEQFERILGAAARKGRSS